MTAKKQNIVFIDSKHIAIRNSHGDVEIYQKIDTITEHSDDDERTKNKLDILQEIFQQDKKNNEQNQIASIKKELNSIEL
mgnify:CR=1 FL=1